MQLKLEAAFARAFAFEAMGEHGQARTLYEHILAAIPGHPGALLCVARQHRRAGELDAARACLEQALEGAKRMALPPAEIWTELGDVRHATGAREAARAAYAQALEASPGMVAALIGLGNLAFDVGDFRGAEMHYRDAVARAPRGMAWVNMAFALESQSRLDEAEAAADEGLRHASQLPEAWQVRASIAFRRGDLTRAEEFCRQGLERFPEQAELLHLLGRILRRAGEVVKAREVLVRAASAAPRNTDILVTLAGISMALGRIADARLELGRALELGASSVEVFDNLGLICEAEGDLPAALEAYARAVARGPTTTSAVANYARALRIACDFERAEVAGSQLLALTDDPSSDPRCPPMVGIFMGASAAQQVTIARRWCESRLPRVAAPLPIRSRGTRLRVGYISSDFRDHPTAHLIAGLFECHDASRVETFGYGTVADDDSAIGRRIRGAFQHWCKLPAARHESNAERIRADSLDVLVDLNGHTRGSRLVVLARRPAPVQIHYMGFPGTIGYEAIEAIVADDIVAPPGAESASHRAPDSAATLLSRHRRVARRGSSSRSNCVGTARRRGRIGVLQPDAQVDAVRSSTSGSTSWRRSRLPSCGCGRRTPFPRKICVSTPRVAASGPSVCSLRRACRRMNISPAFASRISRSTYCPTVRTRRAWMRCGRASRCSRVGAMLSPDGWARVCCTPPDSTNSSPKTCKHIARR